MLNSFKVPNLLLPSEGSMAISVSVQLDNTGNYAGDLTQEVSDGRLDFIQSVYIDNADNASNFDLTLMGAPIPQRIRAQPNTQGWYPVSWPIGAVRFSAASTPAGKVNVIFANYAMPYFTWGAVPGVLVVPNLTNKALDTIALGANSDTQLVAGQLGKTIKLYRGVFSVDAPTVLKWTDGPGGTVLATAQLTAGGSMTFQPSGVPWFNATSPGNDLTLHSTQACNLYGVLGYVQN